MLVSHGDRISTPQAGTLAAAAPGIFTYDGSGTGQGIITVLQGPPPTTSRRLRTR